MSTEMVKRSDSDGIGVAKLGEIFANSGYFRDVRDQAQAVVKILYGRELGFSPVVSMMGIHVIEGKPSLSSNLLGTLVKRSGKYDYRVKVSTNIECTLEFLELVEGKKELLGHSTFTIEDAKNANLVKPNSGWTKYPKAMLFARALSAGIRLHCPDVSACPLYVPEELGATVNEEGAVTQLPKSARPMEVTDKEVVIGDEQAAPPPNSMMKVSGNIQHGPVQLLDPELAQVEALKKSLSEIGGPAKSSSAEQSIGPAKPANGFIEVGQATNFERTFKDALAPKYRKDADTIRHAWLKKQGIVGADGEGTAKSITKENFYDVREEAVTYAARYSE